MAKVSIIIPVYNGEKYLHKCLDSVVNQTLSDIEIICINDCSTDRSSEILNEYAKNDSRFKIINSDKNQGQSISRNIGIDSSSADLIMFIDQDDFYELTACEKAYNQIVKNDNDFVIFSLYNYYPKKNKKVVFDKRLEPFKEVINEPNIKLYELKTNIFIASYIWCEIFKKEFLNKNNIRFFTEKQADDVPFFVKAMVCADNISIIEEPLYN